MAETFSLRVNDTRYEVECEPETPLLYLLRNDLGLFGTRFGCGVGLCGACNVLVDDVPVHSCDTPVWAVVDKAVTTVEGLGTDSAPHPLQRTFVDRQALQCGYCTSGMLVTAAALLERCPDVDDAGVRAALQGNLCRCGSHNRIVAAVLAARPEPT